MNDARRPSVLLATLVSAALLLSPAPADAAGEAQLDQAQALLEADPPQPERALELVEEGLRRAASGRALLLRSTARFMLGQHEAATADLHRALELDPSLRQGWLNLAAVEMSLERYDAAHEALLRAFELDPEADDNDLNLGAVLLLMGRVDEADQHLARYLSRHAEDAEAYFQVAGNYALEGMIDRTVQILARAFELDERLRLRVRRDRRFNFFHHDGFRRLMNTDFYRLPAGSHHVAAAFSVPYDRRDGVLLDAVTEALRRQHVPFDPTIEATDGWALIWGELRIKLSNQPNGTGMISLTAPADRLTASEFHRRTQAVLRTVQQLLEQRLALRRPR
ncbi:MAG: hypothetical protein D6696_07435 [Acidobacteria bacterium]|nr:MAG: hypothetical protein D6696_07435 [Acidobacteriota bacterium]